MAAAERAPRRGHDSGPHVALDALHAAAGELAGLRAVERLAAIATTAAREGVAAHVLALAVLEEDGSRLRIEHVGDLGSPSRQRHSTIPVDDPSLVPQVARSGRPAYLDASAPAHAREAAGVLRRAPGSVAALPLPAADGPVGVLVVGRADPRGFTADETAFLGVLAGLCGSALERMRLAADRSRIREVLRRRQRALRLAGTQLKLGKLRIDLEDLRVDVEGRSATLTPTEIRLLMFLAEEPGRPRTRREILAHLWHTEHVGGARACDTHVWNLRRKIERNPSRPELVVTRRGVGYALEIA